MTRTSRVSAMALAAGLLTSPIESAATTIFSASGVDAAAITPTVTAYQTALGNPNNLNGPGPLASGRREINWDGGNPALVNGTAPVTPFTVFTNTRGATFTTPGTGLTQAAVTGGTLSLDLINGTYADLFAAFSPSRLFSPIGSNETDGSFSIPGTNGAVPAGVRGFGAVFSDVDLANVTTIQYFDIFGTSLGVFPVLPATGNKTFSFFGITRDPNEALIGSIRIITGNSALGPNESATTDLVVMDDFLFAEPQAVSWPHSVVLIGLGLSAAALLTRVRRVGRSAA